MTSTTLYIIAYILFGIAQAMRYWQYNSNGNGYSIELILMTGFAFMFWWAYTLGEIVLALYNAWLTWYLWPKGERWRRLKLAIKRRVGR